ncbi:COMM domain-containing protein 7 [Heterostelium album PN500]|uniref:COMM domain-containing protein 7 n=1 Tax=Heterostelium pallidum (strain ATCC 26659 / Pp 5 / PN500) TaxID=670386 RepID=D3BC90_HETP5|nr:COMM domain-containing protein 7 [Heterostelium album PN500]EFA81273.1 COMM domain-containing protein 7 [Heterostelium album PN500]|eukprot:XP_020433391.1 COMM domain-containing protein 7 [Heterostelium album PN500]
MMDILSEEQAELIAQKYKTSFIGLSRSFVGNTLAINQVLDMQWRFGVTTASSESKKGGNTFLQLKLVLDQGGDNKQEVHMELTLPQFYQFLKEMEQAKASLEYFN